MSSSNDIRKLSDLGCFRSVFAIVDYQIAKLTHLGRT
ncbi:hypothetical protein CCP2SC5_1020005 [Azospirillaceae bacterium]